MARSRIREATTLDDAAVLGLMTEYMTWALATFERTYGFAMAGDVRHTGAARCAPGLADAGLAAGARP
ncbi:hypothetical protein [Streptomyces sp. NBC_01429]|uniref:hypothetical protein n=1 Tax=Streptomyces sp. NBC_01429 TaxID=2903862 RepID=UPI002E2B84A3|nr:hypothetical protein [Streptomyces sp. NBC_01429]